jgi:hypothetical protein
MDLQRAAIDGNHPTEALDNIADLDHGSSLKT